MTQQKSTDADGRYSDVCGATNNRGEPCQLPAGWGTPGSGGERCKFHGGASTGPSDTSHLEGNDHAEGNPGGGAPNGNANAEIHGGFSDWRKAYERFDDATREFVDKIATDYQHEAAEHAPHIPADERVRLCREIATLSVLGRRARDDVWCGIDGSESGRGLVVERAVTRDGTTYSVDGLNPASRAAVACSNRRREIAKRLRLWPGFQ